MPQPHEVVLTQAETHFGQKLTPPPLEHPRLHRLGSGGRYGDLGTCYRALRDFGGFSWLTLAKTKGGFELRDQRSIGHLLYPIPVRLGAWKEQPDLLALVLGEEESRWVSFYRPKQGEVSLASIDWELGGGRGVGRFFFNQPMPRLQVWTGSLPEVAVETICSPRGDLDFVSPAGFFKDTQVVFGEDGNWAAVAFGKSNRAKTICWSDTSLHTFESGGTGTTTVEVTNKGFKYVGFTVMRGTDGNIELFIRVLIGKRDFSPQLILKRVLFNPQKLGELVNIAG